MRFVSIRYIIVGSTHEQSPEFYTEKSILQDLLARVEASCFGHCCHLNVTYT
jgi:hypothetical protein